MTGYKYVMKYEWKKLCVIKFLNLNKKKENSYV